MKFRLMFGQPVGMIEQGVEVVGVADERGMSRTVADVVVGAD